MALGLSVEQKERLLAARTYLLAQMMEIIQERTLIISMLQVRAHAGRHCHVLILLVLAACPGKDGLPEKAASVPRHASHGIDGASCTAGLSKYISVELWA
jgi:hypothetical protein